MKLNMWLIHSWLDQKQIRHFYTIEEDTPVFHNILLSDSENGDTEHAVLYNEAGNHQYISVLSFQESRIYFQDLDAAAASNLLSGLIREFRSWQNALCRLNLAHASLQELLDEAAVFFHFPLLVYENSHTLTSGSSSRDFAGKFQYFLHHTDTEQAVTEYATQSFLLYMDYPYLFSCESGERILADRFLLRQHYVWIFADCSKSSVSDGDRLLLQIIRKYIMQNILFCHPRSSGSPYRNTEDFLLSCITESMDPSSSIQHRPVHFRWPKDAFFTVFCLEYTDKNDTFLLNIAQFQLEQAFPDAASLIFGSSLYLFCCDLKDNPSDSSSETVLLCTLPEKYFYIGQNIPQKGIQSLSIQVRQANEALKEARLEKKHYIPAQSIITRSVYRTFYQNISIQSSVHPAILYLVSLDRRTKHGFSYLKTLEIYLAEGTNSSAAARMLGIHRNTLLGRIQKIKDLTGLSLTDETELESLFLSLLICKDYQITSFSS